MNKPTLKGAIPREIWKDIKDYEGFYQVSNHGRIKSLKRIAWNGRNNMNHVYKERIHKFSKRSPNYAKLGNVPLSGN